VLEKNVSENDIFRLQDSQSAEIFRERLEEFGRKCPHTMQYLKAIPVEKWVLYAQVSCLIVCRIFLDLSCACFFLVATGGSCYIWLAQ
jgi:hypothetical protein